jgi:hypothetical protein
MYFILNINMKHFSPSLQSVPFFIYSTSGHRGLVEQPSDEMNAV